MGWRIALTETARADLKEHLAFIGERNTAVASRSVAQIARAVSSLADFPFQGALVRKHPSYRKIAVAGALVFYRVHESVGIIEIARVWDGRRGGSVLR